MNILYIVIYYKVHYKGITITENKIESLHNEYKVTNI